MSPKPQLKGFKKNNRDLITLWVGIILQFIIVLWLSDFDFKKFLLPAILEIIVLALIISVSISSALNNYREQIIKAGKQSPEDFLNKILNLFDITKDNITS